MATRDRKTKTKEKRTRCGRHGGRVSSFRLAADAADADAAADAADADAAADAADADAETPRGAKLSDLCGV